MRYTYDAADRLTREDNRLLNTSTKYVYDLNGNIAQKSQSVYTADTTLTNATSVSYGYSGDKLVSYNGENFVYDKVGNPTTYRGKTAIWQKGRQLKFFNGVSFEYNGKGMRTKKGSIAFTYDSQGRLISQSNGLEFEYDATGVLGVKYNGNYYVYRKDVQGNVIALLDNLGRAVVQYVYDAWGNHAVLDINGKDITSATHIGTLNPFRYRGYYYDTETGLYYLQTRYYDPELCRFMTIDGIEYVEFNPLSGHNLYAYCGNNPVMNIDPTGEFLLSLLVGMAVGALLGGVVGGVTAVANGDSFLSGFLSGALLGGVLGGAMVLGGATMLAIAGKAVEGFVVASTVAAKAGLLIGSATLSVVASAGAGMGAYAIQESMNGREINVKEMLRQGFNAGIKGGISFITGMFLAAAGAYNSLLVKGKISRCTGFVRGVASFMLQMPWRLLYS